MLTIFLIGLFFMCAGIVAGALAWILAHFIKKSPEGRINIRQGGFIAKSVFVLAGGGGLLLGLSIVSFVVSGIWWGLSVILKNMTPGGLALLSLFVGVLPLIVAILGAGLAKILKGHVDARGARDCFLFGFDLNGLVYVLFMSYWGVFLTGGLAMFGLIGSGIWAALR
jgi:hypothetical protein